MPERPFTVAAFGHSEYGLVPNRAMASTPSQNGSLPLRLAAFLGA